MKQNNNQEILKMTKIILERYPIESYEEAKTLAIELYKNNIKSSFFNPHFYQKSFDLDEIVLYLLKKINDNELLLDNKEKSNKTINQSENKNIFFDEKEIKDNQTNNNKIIFFDKYVSRKSKK